MCLGCMFDYKVSKQEVEVRRQLSDVENNRPSLSTYVPAPVENSEGTDERAELSVEENTVADASLTEGAQSEEKEEATTDAMKQQQEDRHGVVETNAEEEENGKWER